MNNAAIQKDFSRNIWCILGLGFDAVNQTNTIDEIIASISENRRCNVVTPNLNFLSTALQDTSFKDAVLNSDLSLADGMPLIWVAKLLKIPLTERVSGSNLMESLFNREPSKPIKVFFFGGEAGVGERASKQVNQSNAGLVASGNLCPGFGTVDEMSSDEIIDEINSYDIDFLIVSLGAKKGLAWIEHNKERLNAAVICHLGAVINFFAGTVVRAPVGLQRFGLEWLWRIYQEPALWKRYFFDGLTFFKLLLFYVAPYALYLRVNKVQFQRIEPVEVQLEEYQQANKDVLIINGNCTGYTINPLRKLFCNAVVKQHNVVLDLAHVPVFDGAFIGLCLILRKQLNAYHGNLSFRNVSSRNRLVLIWNLGGFLLE